MPRDIDGIIDDIDRLVDEQMQQEASGYDHNLNVQKCPHCDGEWHGLAMAGCPGSDFIGPPDTPRMELTLVETRTPDGRPVRRLRRSVELPAPARVDARIRCAARNEARGFYQQIEATWPEGEQ